MRNGVRIDKNQPSHPLWHLISHFQIRARRRTMRKMAITSVIVALALANPSLPGAASPQSDSTQDTTLHSQVDLVSVYFTVRDEKKHLAGQPGQDHFRVFADASDQT